MKKLFQENYRLFKASFKQVLLFELFYKAVFLVLFLPLSGFLLDATVKLSGFRYLTNENLYSYLKNPTTWLLLLLVVLLNLLYLMGEFCTLLILIQGVQTPKPVKLRRKIVLGLLWLLFIRAMQGCCGSACSGRRSAASAFGFGCSLPFKCRICWLGQCVNIQ